MRSQRKHTRLKKEKKGKIKRKKRRTR